MITPKILVYFLFFIFSVKSSFVVPNEFGITPNFKELHEMNLIELETLPSYERLLFGSVEDELKSFKTFKRLYLQGMDDIFECEDSEGSHKAIFRFLGTVCETSWSLANRADVRKLEENLLDDAETDLIRKRLMKSADRVFYKGDYLVDHLRNKNAKVDEYFKEYENILEMKSTRINYPSDSIIIMNAMEKYKNLYPNEAELENVLKIALLEHKRFISKVLLKEFYGFMKIYGFRILRVRFDICDYLYGAINGFERYKKIIETAAEVDNEELNWVQSELDRFKDY